ncbi:MAG TPA: anti-sigma factor [Solirubrobacteraceae bacterium]|nr:anti-sigma factor [Solirubrobacteraceae bacterium]
MSDGKVMSQTHDCGGDAAAYVLGALEPAEADAFRQHLDQCAVCRDEVDALTGTVQALPMAAPQLAPPKQLRQKVLRATGTEPKRARRRIAWPVPRMALATLGAALLVAAVVVTGVELSSSGSSGRVIQAHVTGVSGSAELRVSGGRGELIVRNLTPPPAGKVYEVWLAAPGAKPAPASVLFGVNSRGGADVGIPATLTGISQVMVTPEPRGGSVSPTHAPVIVASLT